jgi:hypothetical protein
VAKRARVLLDVLAKGDRQMNRRDFFKTAFLAVAPLLLPNPVRLFVPPRRCFVNLNLTALNRLVSQLGVMPTTDALNVCEGVVEEIAPWDGIGYHCLVRNACTFGANPPRVWIYDFDLWNFRHDDHMGAMHLHPEGRKFNSHAAWYASRRFGADAGKIVHASGGWLKKQIALDGRPV